MADFIQPLALKTWIINVFSGSTEIFSSLAIIFLAGMAGYFRMTAFTFTFLLVLFLVMFNSSIDQSLLLVIFSLGSLLAGYWLKNIVK